MPLCYGGGVKTEEQVERIISLGVEKVSLSSVVVSDPELVARAAEIVGQQSIVVVMDVKGNGRGGNYERPLKNVQFWSRSRKARISTTGIY